jgi:hypothetical protein
LVVGLFGWLRFASALREWDYLIELAVRPSPLILAIGGAVWGLLGWGIVALIGVNVPGDWNRPVIFALAKIVALIYWVDVLFFTRPAEMLGNWPYALALTCLTLIYLFFLLQLPLWWRTRKEAVHVHE